MIWQTMTQSELDQEFAWGGTGVATPPKPEDIKLVVRITYEASGNEPLHPDPEIASRMTEYVLGDCGFGCKVYKDPRSAVRVLAHNRSYGCPK